MTKLRATLVAIISILAGGVYVADTYMGIDILGMLFPDDKAPVIDTSDFISSVQLNGTINYSTITCTDNEDETCNVVLVGSIDSSVLGEQTVTITATDEAGNKAEKELTITVFEGVNPALYIPDGYYDALDGVSDDQLKAVLNDIITGHEEFYYTHSTKVDVWDILREADEDPNNPDNVILFYSGDSRPKDCQDGKTDMPALCDDINQDDEDLSHVWNREHIWSKSRGDFEHEGTSTYAKGAHTDGHHLVAADKSLNSTKNNRMFEDCHDGDDDVSTIVDVGYGNFTCGVRHFEPRDEVKGDVARMIFYMAVRYEGEEGDYVDLEVVNDPDATQGSKLPVYGDIDDLLRWHLEDPVDEWEINRNNVIYSYQKNRNPFIDMPELVEKIWGKSEDYN